MLVSHNFPIILSKHCNLNILFLRGLKPNDERWNVMLMDYHLFKKWVKKCEPSKMIYNYISWEHECSCIEWSGEKFLLLSNFLLPITDKSRWKPSSHKNKKCKIHDTYNPKIWRMGFALKEREAEAGTRQPFLFAENKWHFLTPNMKRMPSQTSWIEFLYPSKWSESKIYHVAHGSEFSEATIIF